MGENPAFYRRFGYDGVPLLGHNGIDFLTPLGTPLLATDAGAALTAGYEPGGRGISYCWPIRGVSPSTLWTALR